MMTQVKTEAEIKEMREAGAMLASILNLIDKQLTPGMSGKDAAEIARKELDSLGASASFLGYQGFPDVICISVNDAVVHGIPNNVPFEEGDVVSFDFGVTIDKMVTDSAYTAIVGKGTKQTEALVAKTEQSLMAGIDQVKDGAKTGDIAAAIEIVLSANNLGIVRDLVGHGVGHELHEEPNFPNFGTPGTGPSIQAGWTICLEPMATMGDYKVGIDRDGWTIRSRDNSLAAHFEHTILVTEDGAEILTDRR